MVKRKNINRFIFICIYLLLIGCEDNIMAPVCESDCYLEVSAPSLEMDSDGYYHLEWIEGYSQTFSTLDADVGMDYQRVLWTSNKEVNYNGYWVNCVNSASYSDDEGIAHTVVSAWEVLVGDTITVYSGTFDECDYEHLDSLKIIVEDLY